MDRVCLTIKGFFVRVSLTWGEGSIADFLLLFLLGEVSAMILRARLLRVLLLVVATSLALSARADARVTLLRVDMIKQ